jgi:hypothetical protein
MIHAKLQNDTTDTGNEMDRSFVVLGLSAHIIVGVAAFLFPGIALDAGAGSTNL